MLVAFGFVILFISFIIAFLSLISEEKKQRQTALDRVVPSVPAQSPEDSRSVVSKEDIVKIATNSRIANQASLDEEILPESKPKEPYEVKKVVDQAFPWEEDASLPKQEEFPKPSVDPLFGEFKMPKKEE